MTSTGYQTEHRPQTDQRPQVVGADRRRRTFTETKAGYKTTEFVMAAVFVIGVLVATYADSDSLARADGWRYASFAVVAYLVSRGLSKLGVSEPYTEDDAS